MAKNVYKDISLNFQPVPQTGDVSSVSDVNSIIQSIKSLILSRPNERLFQERVFSELFQSLFEIDSPFTRSNIETSIINVIKNYEPRATVLSVVAKVPLNNNNAYKVTIVFVTKLVQNAVTFDFLLQRVR